MNEKFLAIKYSNMIYYGSVYRHNKDVMRKTHTDFDFIKVALTAARQIKS